MCLGNGFEISVELINGQVLISANKAGLVSLANQLLNLSQDAAPSGSHMHLDDYDSLEAGSIEMVIPKS